MILVRGKALLLAAGALLLSAPALGNDANMVAVARTLELEESADLNFGVIIKPTAGNAGGGELEMTCGGGGVATVTTPGNAINPDLSDDECGSVTITPAHNGQTVVITFGETGGGVSFGNGGGVALETQFSLFDGSGTVVGGLEDVASDDSASSEEITLSAATVYYIGATARISDVTPVDEYTAVYEITVSPAE